MIIIGIIFLVLFTFLGLSIIGWLSTIDKTLKLNIKRYDEIIRIMKR